MKVSMNDALGNPIVFGQKYAVSEHWRGGLVVTNVGIASKITPAGKVTLQLVRGIIHHIPTPEMFLPEKPMKYSVLPGLLFPVSQ
jgi:hypothetical protein